MRIHITGASGSGSSTLARALAVELGGTHIDTDSYFWLPTTPPFRQSRSAADRVALLEKQMSACEMPILAGACMGWAPELEDSFDLIVFLYLDTGIRLERLRKRELETLGYADPAFLNWAAQYDDGPLTAGRSLARHRAWLATRSCQVLELNGPLTVRERMAAIALKAQSPSLKWSTCAF